MIENINDNGADNATIRDKKIILDILLKDLEIMRAEAKDVAAAHWTYSVPFTLAIVTTFIASFYKAELIFLVPFFILAQLAAIMNNHYGYIYLLGSYIKVIEKKINEMIGFDNLVEYQNEFVDKYFSEAHPKLQLTIHDFIEQPQPYLEIFMVVPSVVIYAWSICGSLIHIYGWHLPLILRITLIVFTLIIYLWLAKMVIYYIYFKGFARVRENLECHQNEALKKFRERKEAFFKDTPYVSKGNVT